jgi:bis(5'-nucleosyl)-tetraphosphatase (symmetrical)
MAIYAIGDLQGCYDPFRHLLDIIRFDPGNDTLWLTGDLVNRGPKSLKTLRFVKSLGDSAVTVLGNHDLHLLALSQDAVPFAARFESLEKLLKAPDRDELFDWLRHRPLAYYSEGLDTLLVHAGTYPTWSVAKTLRRAAEVEAALQGPKFDTLLNKMYGNRPRRWSGGLKGYSRLRFIINCLTRMRMMTPDMQLNMRATGTPWRSKGKRVAWFEFPDPAWGDSRIVFGHWSQLGLIVLPGLISLDTGCIWGRQLTAVRIDRRVARVYQVPGQGR